jgi:hypothetical protein
MTVNYQSSLMMRIIQLFAEQDVVSLHRTLLDTMNSVATREATTRGEEQIGIVRGKTR